MLINQSKIANVVTKQAQTPWVSKASFRTSRRISSKCENVPQRRKVAPRATEHQDEGGVQPVGGSAEPMREPSLSQRLVDIARESSIAPGKVAFKPLEPGAESDLCVVLARAFMGTPEEISMTDATRYVDRTANNLPKSVLYIARLYPNDTSILAPNRDSRLIGTVALSFDPATIEEVPTLPPPPNTAYLSNMAVDAKFRRLGIGAELLRMCDEAARLAGFQEIYLHVRQGDEAACSLYKKHGYEEVARDNFLSAALKRVRPRVLMKYKL